jgi:hypothetical protein
MAPLVELDHTVAELYRKHGIRGPFITTTHCAFAQMDPHPEWPREATFPEDEEPIPYGDDDEEEKNRLRRIILGLKPVRRALALGDMDVIMLLASGISALNVERVFNHLVPHQRPRPKYINLEQGHVHERLLELGRGKKLVYWRPQGWTLEHNCMVPPQVAYELNSKEYLARSGIPTPASQVVTLPDNLGPSTEYVLSARQLPFVVKLFLAACGFGTHLVTTEARRQTMLEAMVQYKKRGGSSVLMSDYIDARQSNISAHFVIGAPGDERDKRDPLLLGVATQSLTADGRWTGGSIDYGAQPELQALVQDTIRDTTSRMPDSFVGWCGVDIMIDKQDKQWVVDLNARYTGSVALCLLSKHFHKRLGLRFAEAGSFRFGGDCAKVYDVLSQQIESGDIVVNALVNLDDKSAMVDLIWGGRSREDLARLGEHIGRELQRLP